MFGMAKVRKITQVTWKKSKLEPRLELLSILAMLGKDELNVMVRIARRLLVGKERYGLMNLKNDKRDYEKEAFEEILDWLVYNEMTLERKFQVRKKSTRKRASALTKP